MTVQHFKAVTEVVVKEPARVVITLTPTAAEHLASILAHVVMRDLDIIGLPHPADLDADWTPRLFKAAAGPHNYSGAWMKDVDWCLSLREPS